MNIQLTHFTKRENSTLRPTTFNWNINTAVLKESTSIIRPTFLIDRVEYDTHIATYGYQYNYVYVPDSPSTQDYPVGRAFSNRYYFITDIRYNHALVEIDCEVDVLATYKTEIGASTQYILRAASANNTRLPDELYPAIADVTRQILTFTSPWSTSFASGTMIVGILGTGATVYCAFAPEDLTKFLNYLFDPGTTGYAAKVIGALSLTGYPQYKMVVDPMQYISSVMWIPQSYTSGTRWTVVKVGYTSVDLEQDCGITGNVYTVDDPVLTITRTFTLSQHPQTVTNGMYTNISPWTRYILDYPPFGIVELDSTLINNTYGTSDSVQIHTIVQTDVRVGTSTLYVQRRTNTSGSITGEENLIKLNAQIGVSMQIGAVLQPGYGVAANLSQIGGGISTLIGGGRAGTAIANAFGAVGDALRAEKTQMSSIGSSGGVDALRGNCTLYEIFYHSAPTDNAQHGKPLCATRQINTLSGYVLCMNAEITAGETLEEKQRIINFMNGGFFYE